VRHPPGGVAAARRCAPGHRPGYPQHGTPAAPHLRSGAGTQAGRGRRRLRDELRRVRRRVRRGGSRPRRLAGRRRGTRVPAATRGDCRRAARADRPVSAALVGFVIALGAGGTAAVLALSVSARRRPAAVGIATATSGGAAVVAGVAGLAGQTFAVSLPDLLPLFGVHLALDPLGGLFIAVTGGVAVAASAYGIGYAADDEALRSRAAQLALPVFVVAMVLVPVAASVGTFLVSWELMALSSLVLVVVEHRRRPQVAAAGRWYAVMTHLGVLAILLGLAVLAAGAGGETFAALRAAEFSPVVRDVAFVTTLLGFASKAGVVPLHAWLPRA